MVTSYCKPILWQNIDLKVSWMDVLIWKKNNISFSRYLDFCAFDESVILKICDVIIDVNTH